jgi:hypothetical protein
MTSNAAVARMIAESSDGSLRVTHTKKGAARVVSSIPGALLDENQVISSIWRAGFCVLSVIEPGNPHSRSGLFSTYVIHREGYPDSKHHLVVGTGANRGQRFERDLIGEVSAHVFSCLSSQRSISLLSGLGLDASDVSGVNKPTSRPHRILSPELRDVGSVISDMTLTLMTGELVHISLKERSGDTFINSGYVGGFVVDHDSKSVRSEAHQSDPLILALGIDKDLAAEGFTSRLRGEKVERHGTVSGSQDPERVRDYLIAAFGYGYWYVRENPFGLRVIDLRCSDAPRKLVGDVTKIDLIYPGRSKQITASIRTTGGRFKVEVRNSKGNFDPNEIKIKCLELF